MTVDYLYGISENIDKLAGTEFVPETIWKNSSENAFRFRLIGHIFLTESFEISGETIPEGLLKALNAHYEFMRFTAESDDEKFGHDPKEFDAEITAYDENGKKIEITSDITDDLSKKFNGVKRFSVKTFYKGCVFFDDDSNESTEPLYRCIDFDSLKESYDITYKCYANLEEGTDLCAKYENGSWIDVKEQCTQQLVDIENEEDGFWCIDYLNLVVEFNEENREAIRKLKKITKEHLPEDEMPYIEEFWGYVEEEEKAGRLFLLTSHWHPDTLREAQDYLDAVNEVVLPLKDKCTCSSDDEWHFNDIEAIAFVKWTEEGFKIFSSKL